MPGKGRQVVKPIRDKKVIQRVKEAMMADENYKFLALFVLGISTGLRIGDLLALRWEDLVVGSKMKTRLVVTEHKTGKRQEIPLTKNVLQALRRYREECKEEGYVFASYLGKPMSYQYVHRVLNHYIRERAGFQEAVGAHTLRKTFGYQAYCAGWDLYRIQECLNHSHPAVTRRYIDLSQDDKDQVYASLNL
ncbi:MAG TPA: tyrosine-type recombinase/integrase [Thermotogota bacterium]|nr:tyrosine-type recombinase/integrase [Thermotogota bacterium]